MLPIDTEYAVKLFFPSSTFPQIYFEAVANALDAGANSIHIEIKAEEKIKPENFEITISDNGEGFSEERFERFRSVKEPKDKYHKGLGRLVYLQYFSEVEVTSLSKSTRRDFVFSGDFSGDSEVTTVKKSKDQGTTLKFKGFRRKRLQTYRHIQPSFLKPLILEQFLPILYQRKREGKDFEIILSLQPIGKLAQGKLLAEKESITPREIPEFEFHEFQDNEIHAFCNIKMFYMLQKQFGDNINLTAYCIDGRTVPVELIGRNSIPASYSAIFLFESELFTGRSDSSRQRIMLPESVSDVALNRLLRQEMSIILNERLPEIVSKNQKVQKKFEERYPHLIGLFEEDTVGLIDKDEALEIAQRRFFKKQKQILSNGRISDSNFQDSLEFSSRALAEYILYRNLIIDRLKETDEEDQEAKIHNLIVPRYESFESGSLINDIYRNNAWLLDDKFMSFRTILSEAKMQDIIDVITDGEQKVDAPGRPDISMIFSADPSESQQVDVVIVEIKRRKNDEKENIYAETQLVKRARKLADYCPSIQRSWYFGVIEIDSNLSQLLRDLQWKPLFSRGQVFYKPFSLDKQDGVSVPVSAYLVSFDAVIEDAAARNHTFLEILKDGFKKASSQTDETSTR